MKITDVQLAVHEIHANPEVDATADEIDEAIRKVVPLLKVLWSGIPWWKKAFVGLKALIGALTGYLGEES